MVKIVYLLKNTRIHKDHVLNFSLFIVLSFLYAGGLNIVFEMPVFFVFVAFFSTLLIASAFGINNVFDVENDRREPSKCNLIAEGKISKKEAHIFSVLLGVFSLIFFLFTNWVSFFIALLIFLFGYIYSAPPVRLKSRPFLDLLYHGSFAGFFIFLLGYSLAGPVGFDSLLVCVPLFFFFMMVQLRNHLGDYESDKRAGTNTTVVFFGVKKSKRLYFVFVLICFFATIPVFLRGIINIPSWFFLTLYLALFYYNERNFYSKLETVFFVLSFVFLFV